MSDSTVDIHDQVAREISVDVDDIIFRDDLYPRIKHDPSLVQRYAEDLDILPPIEVNQRNELIDGWHRWTAHKKIERKKIRALITTTTSDVELLEFAIQRNASHGLQLSRDDKRKMALRIYGATAPDERAGKKESLAVLLSVGKSTISGWLSDIDASTKAERDEKIRGMWMACYTDAEIGKQIGLTDRAVAALTEEFPDLERLPKLQKQYALYDEPEFAPPIYNVWSWAKNSVGPTHFGNSHSQIVDYLVYLYTKPFDVVIDPFAGSGSTIDICLRRSRRYLVSDRKPIPERLADIRIHDVGTGLLKPPQWKDVSLVYLDPPYWVQAAGEYSEDKEDLANMSLKDFHELLISTLCNGFSNGALPFLIAWYWPYNWSFYVVPVNAAARGFFKENIRLTEQEYVSGLYRMRGRMVERHILSELNRQKPPSDGIQPRHGYGREHP